jgi:hypothetical protein
MTEHALDDRSDDDGADARPRVGMKRLQPYRIALFRARVLARWAAALLALGAVATLAVPVLPTTLDRILAVPTGVALVGLGYSLWRTARTDTTTLLATVRSPHVTTAGAE